MKTPLLASILMVSLGATQLSVVAQSSHASSSMGTRTIPVHKVDPQDLVGAVEALLSPGGSVAPSRQGLEVKDYPAVLNQASRVVSALDVSAPHVRLHLHLGPPGQSHTTAPQVDTQPEAHGSVATINAGESHANGTAVNDLTVRVLNGATEWLQLEDRSTDAKWLASYCHGHHYVSANLDFNSADTGIELTPVTAGPDVILTVTPFIRYHAAIGDGRVTLRSERTQVRVSPGETSSVTVTESQNDGLYRHIFGSLAPPADQGASSYFQVDGEIDTSSR